MERTQAEIRKIVENQRSFFRSGKTLDISWRLEQLKKLKQALSDHEAEIEEALHEDLGRSPAEAYFCDIGAAILEINEIIRGLRRWARPELHYSVTP